MKKTILTTSTLLSILISVALPVFAAGPELIKTFPSLPTHTINEQYQEVENGFNDRANLFLKGRQFHAYQKNRSKSEILEEFNNIQEWRNNTWYSDSKNQPIISRPDFIVAQDLLEKGYYRKPNIIPFEYNQTSGMYNSSTIVLNGLHFLAMQGPSEPLVRNFAIVLQNHQVKQLVRLTPAVENGNEKSYPYWEGKESIDPKTKENILSLPSISNEAPSYTLRYFAINSWADNKGIDPKVLLKSLNTVRKNFDASQDLLAVHCAGGVGRTGTFIAGYILLNEIDRQLKNGVAKDKLDISIEKVVMQLSLQRVQMVATPDQYVTLYRLLDLYLQSK